MYLDRLLLQKEPPKDTKVVWGIPNGDSVTLMIHVDGIWRPINGSDSSSESGSGCNCENSDNSGSGSSTTPDTTEPILLTGETYGTITTPPSEIDILRIVLDELNISYDSSILNSGDLEIIGSYLESLLSSIPEETAQAIMSRLAELGSSAETDLLQTLNDTPITTETHGKVVQVYYNPQFGYIFECEDGCGITYDGNNKLSVIPAELRYAITEDYAGGYDRFTGESIPNCMVHQLTTTVARINAQTSYGLMPVYTLAEYKPNAPSDGVDGSDPVIYSVWHSSSGGYDIILGVENAEPDLS